MSPLGTEQRLKPMSDKPDDDRDYDDGPFPRTETSSDDKALRWIVERPLWVRRPRTWAVSRPRVQHRCPWTGIRYCEPWHDGRRYDGRSPHGRARRRVDTAAGKEKAGWNPFRRSRSAEQHVQGRGDSGVLSKDTRRKEEVLHHAYPETPVLGDSGQRRRQHPGGASERRTTQARMTVV